MHKKFQENSKKYIILPIALLGLAAVLAWSTTEKVSAFTRQTAGRSEFAAVLAQKFGLDQTVVEETIQEYHQAERELRRQEMESRLEAKLETAVAQGQLTQVQMQAILEKHDELEEKIQELKDQDLSREDFREMKADLHEEMQVWAEEQGIDFEVFMRVGKGMMEGSRGMGPGRGMHLIN